MENEISTIKNEIIPMDSNIARSVAEVQGEIFIAQQYQRDESRCIINIQNACKHKLLAEKALYSYPKAGVEVTGPSIRLAEMLAMNWSNFKYGIKEISNKLGETKYIAYAFDMQKNVRSEREFTQKHIRNTKKGSYEITDQREIYELVASSASRRMRACILQLIPSYVIEGAIAQCELTMKSDDLPIETRIKNILLAFQEIGVTQDMIEKRIKHKIAIVNETELVSLRKIYSSIKDGMSDRLQWFEFSDEVKNKLNERFGKKEEEK